jgi:uncharacterized protein
MNTRIILSFGDLEIGAVLDDNETSKKIIGILPFDSDISLWGNEIYFSVPVANELEDAKEELEVGEIAFWPPGSAFCIFFGKTPASTGDLPKAISPVTPIGRLWGKKALEDIKKVASGDQVVMRIKE